MIATEVTAPSSAAQLQSRRARRQRRRRRIEDARLQRPDLRTDRASPIWALVQSYGAGRIGPTALRDYVDRVRSEVVELERHTLEQLPAAVHSEGATIRRALCFLRNFGRIGCLDLTAVSTGERDGIVELLRLEYRWCFAAAGTTPEAFKTAIGRTGAR